MTNRDDRGGLVRVQRLARVVCLPAPDDDADGIRLLSWLDVLALHWFCINGLIDAVDLDALIRKKIFYNRCKLECLLVAHHGRYRDFFDVVLFYVAHQLIGKVWSQFSVLRADVYVVGVMPPLWL